MKFNLIFNKKPLVIDAPEHLAYMSILMDEVSPEMPLYDEMFTWLCGEVIKLARIHIDERINHCEFTYPTFDEQANEGIIDNIHFYTIEGI